MRSPKDFSTGVSVSDWTLLSNHAHVLICLSLNPEFRMRDIAERVGITERAVQRIVADLEEADILTREREGRRNRYTIHPAKPLRHPLEAHCTVGELLDLIETTKKTEGEGAKAAVRIDLLRPVPQRGEK